MPEGSANDEPEIADEARDSEGQSATEAASEDKPASSAVSSVEVPEDAAISVLPMPDLPPPESVPVPQAPKAPKIVPSAIVDDVAPPEGPVIGGTRLTLTGSHLYRESIVRIDGMITQTIGAREPHELRVLVPARDDDGAVDITVQNPGSPLTSLPAAFRYTPLPAPKIDSVAPSQAASAGGTEIAIAGEHFVEQTSVMLGRERATTVAFIDAQHLEVVVPAGKAGTFVDVSVENPDGKRDTTRRAFKYV